MEGTFHRSVTSSVGSLLLEAVHDPEPYDGVDATASRVSLQHPARTVLGDGPRVDRDRDGRLSFVSAVPKDSIALTSRELEDMHDTDIQFVLGRMQEQLVINDQLREEKQVLLSALVEKDKREQRLCDLDARVKSLEAKNKAVEAQLARYRRQRSNMPRVSPPSVVPQAQGGVPRPSDQRAAPGAPPTARRQLFQGTVAGGILAVAAARAEEPRQEFVVPTLDGAQPV